ncbi:hypothetical protein PHMEG_00017150 [Phytophthora megakarya]|uniref:Uncharacterized protein n=1 Tax=Phytophthora megakarya TaxID=4795 RepID=A0A225VYL9_9STRA|nr:hypothetical protein PHMEG_00017150 [Phytophthora megakarya]
MKEADKAMVPHHSGGMPIAVYPPLPPFPDVDLQVSETTTWTATIQVVTPNVKLKFLSIMLPLLIKKLLHDWDKYSASTITSRTRRRKTCKRSMNDRLRYSNSSMRCGQRLESLAEAVEPRLQARWGGVRSTAPSADSRSSEELSTVTVAAGTNLPVPPI